MHRAPVQVHNMHSSYNTLIKQLQRITSTDLQILNLQNMQFFLLVTSSLVDQDWISGIDILI